MRVLITGGSRGIGLAVAEHLAARGHELLLIARDGDRLEHVVAALAGCGHSYHALDVTDEAGWAKVEVEGVGGLVCAAAALEPIGVVGEYDPAAFRRTLDINVVGTLLAVHWCRASLLQATGAIVLFGGGGATRPLPRYDAYAASKAAVARLTENLALALAPVVVNCVAPGFVATEMHNATLAAGPAAAGEDYWARTRAEVDRGGYPAVESAELVAMLLERAPFSGKLLSAQWDPWRDVAFHERLTNDPDLATVRRIDDVAFRKATPPE